jgi:hypothetical protein
MIYIPIIIIIIILVIDFYFTYDSRFKSKKNETFKNEVIEFDEPNPWNKVKEGIQVVTYYLKVNNLDDHIEKILLWKQHPSIRDDLIDVDIPNKYLILTTSSEEEALVIANLLLSHMNNNITMQEVISKNLINNTISKAQRFKLINTKLVELIKENVRQLNNQTEDFKSIDTNDDIDVDVDNDVSISNVIKEKMDPIQNKVSPQIKTDIPLENSIPLISRVQPYEGSEYATI